MTHATSPAPQGPGFYPQLQTHTAQARAGLTQIPVVAACLAGTVSRASYLAFLQEAYHHVRHTVPLLQTCKAALSDNPAYAWLLPALDEYIEEETGHEQWILNDIAAAGGDRQAAEHSAPGAAADIMVAYAYDLLQRRNPLGLFGMVHVLEGTSVALALLAADRIQQALGLPNAAFSYLRSHGTLDVEHTEHFARLMDRIDNPDDQAAILQASLRFCRLYGDVFRDLPLPQPQQQASPAMEAA